MIVTITLNPAVDISYTLDELLQDTVNRVDDVSKTAGGKGLNVARVLNQLGEEVAASGFLGGSLGSYIHSSIQAIGIKDLFVPIEGETRNCIALIHEGKQTEILESGPVISADEATQFLAKFSEIASQAELITVSGSLPKGLAADFYVKMIEISSKTGTPVLLDSNGALLTNILVSSHKPFLVKPNKEELEQLLGRTLRTEAQIKESLEDPLFEGVQWVVVTLGADGAIIKNGKTVYRAKIPVIQAVNPVGSGDSVVAGFASGLVKGLTADRLIAYGLAMGVLNALEEKTGQIDVNRIDWVSGQIQVETID